MTARSHIARGAVVLAIILGTTTLVLADGLPWRPRRTPGLRPNRIAAARVDPQHWPQEPESPAEIDPERFARALHEICGWMPPARPAIYTGWILRYAREFGEDPFLLAALVYRRTEGACRPDAEGPNGELGLTLIRREMYAETFRRGEYRYQIRHGGQWVERTRRIDRFPFAGPRLRRAEENIYFAAALLSAWRDQHLSVDAAFDQVPHRHHVSHFVWGDRVRSDRQEDRILTDRRRMLHYYGAIDAVAPVVREGISFGGPLDGGPRVVSSGLGSDREGGTRAHRGVDVESLPGETVRAIADGRVVFAGVDLPGNSSNEQLRVGEYDRHPRRSLGAGGRFVCILHPREGAGALRSCYMHLETVALEARQQVSRGDVVGTVGRTGMQQSAAHLHLELHGPEGVMNPLTVLRGLLIGDPNPEL